MSKYEGFFLSRQPIVASERRLIGWKLAIESVSQEAFDADGKATHAYLDALEAFASTADWESLLCGGRAFLRADRRIVYSDVLELFPRNRLVLELPLSIEVNAALSNRLHDLHSRRGVRLVFLDYARRDEREVLLDLADAVQVDAVALGEEARILLRRAKRRGLQVMASSVRRDTDFLRVRDAGFDLIHGVSYQEPSQDKVTHANQDGRMLLRLLVEAGGEIEISKVTKAIESNQALAEGLLRLVNSLELARAQKIESVGQALIMIGAKGLTLWLVLLLFQVGNHNGMRGPLFRVAASRAKTMELITLASVGTDTSGKERGHEAFLVGILSLVHVLLAVDRKTAISDLGLPDEMSAALCDYQGELGRLLRFAECLDRGDIIETGELSVELGLSTSDVWGHQKDAYAWVTKMG